MQFELVYIISVLALAAAALWMGFRREGSHKYEASLLRKIAVIVSVTVCSSVLAILLPWQGVSLFFQCLHYASTEWMMVHLLVFLEYYVGIKKINMRTHILIFAYAGVSTVSMFANMFFHHIVESERVQTEHGAHVNKFTTLSPFYELHLYFCYLLVLITFIAVIIGLFRSVRLYRKKYILALLLMSATVAVDVTCAVKGYLYDISLYGYIILVLLFEYLTLYFLPNDVINRMLSAMVLDSVSGALCFDAEDKCVYVNEPVLRHYPKDVTFEVFEVRYKKLMGVEHFRDAEEKKWLQSHEEEGGLKYYDMAFKKLHDDKGHYIGCSFSMYDKTGDMERFQQESYKAAHDGLTDLYNREYFYDRVQEILYENPDEKYYVVCTDIKDFKLINNLFGYEMGNEILRRFADKLKTSLPEDVVSARLMSDKFAFCIKKEMFSEQYLNACLEDAQSLLSTSEFQLHVHAGIYEVQPQDRDVSVICDYANMAIRTVKDNYDTIVVYYDEKLMSKIQSGRIMINEFENAIENHQFVMYLQPQVDTDGSVHGAEALVRWIHPEKGMISPGEFIPVFEDAGIIYRLDQCIWEQAAKKLAEWKKQGVDMHISVNISTKDFYYIDLYKTFTELVEKYDISPDKLKLEITESALMQDMDKQLELISRLQTYGFHVEIDDFGSGYSSLNMLKNVRADVLKIDMGFLQEIQDHERNRIILGMVVDLAKRLQMVVITEGVETRNQVDYLTEIGCDMFQGFYFARPIAVEEFENKYLSA